MTTATDLDLRHYTHEDLPRIRQTLLDVHADACADQMDDPFVQRFPWFVDHWGGNPGFSRAIGYDCDEPVGYAYGAPATPGREWWRKFLDPAPEASRTFVLSVDVEHPKVRALYESWGYRKAGEQQPFADSPLFAVMLAGLPLPG
ncbi:GNAT family N-acetyltransferase [Streptomyces nanhaiensis]|uniref:GNAT family N-acetyltransferase n=1 Tax=Streptomyces nanhaiensis TaxID=679319 RepID=UPI00399D12BF